jgi:MFS family permease
MLFFGFFYGVYVANVYKDSAADLIDDKILTYAGMIGAFCNGSSRVVWAALMDKYGFKRVYGCLLVLQCICAS